MDYIANVENSEIDVSGIRTVLVQGDSSYPVIRFVLDPSLTGLSWRVRGTYTATNIAVLSPEILATESATEITIDWSVGSDFTTYDGDMQLSLVGANDAGTTVVKALADITIQQDWSIGTMGAITLNLFEQLMAQADATISKYPYIDEVSGNWFVWNPTLGEWVDTGESANGAPSYWYTGTTITGTDPTPTAFPSSGITAARYGDMYLNEETSNVYRCTSGGDAATALWSYRMNNRGIQGEHGIQGEQGKQGIQGDPGTDGERGTQTFSGSAITGTSTTPTAYATGITLAVINDRYRNTDSGSASYQNEYVCTFGGNAATALWTYDGNVRGATGATGTDGVGVPSGGTANQLIYKIDGTDYNTGWKSVTASDVSALPGDSTSSNIVINGNFSVNQRGVSGTVTLAAGAYGHDRWKAGASGCTYTFATSENVTTLTISAGSLLQVVEGINLQSGTVCLSWTGTAQGKIGAGSYSASGVTGTATGGANLDIEFNTGTVSKVQLNNGAVALPYVPTFYALERINCGRYAYPLTSGGARYRLQSYTANTMDFGVLTSVPLRGTPTIVDTPFVIYNMAGTAQTGFTFSVLMLRENRVLIRGTKTAHALTDGYLSIDTTGMLDSEI